jgi:hypothetical protein
MGQIIVGAADEPTVRAVFDAAFVALPDYAVVPVDNLKGAAEYVYHGLADGMCLIAVDDDGEIEGSLSLCAAEVPYSTHRILVDRWFWLMPGVSFARVGRAAAKIADSRGMVALIRETRRKTKAGSEFTQVAEAVGYFPMGRDIQINH